MNQLRTTFGLGVFCTWVLWAVLVAHQARAQGILIPAAGPINQSMGGAAVAAPLDAMGALYWNPAGISALPSSEMSFNLGLILPTNRMTSTLPANSFGPGVPPVTLTGTEQSEPGVMPVPSMAYVYQDPGSNWTYGIGVFGIGGLAVNFPGSTTNPVLTPPPPFGFGLGHVYAQVEILQVLPTVAYSLTDSISIGLSPTIDLGRVMADPLFFAPPDDANGDGFATFPPGTAARYVWGLGGHLGVFYTGPAGWNLGASIKSPQWFEKFRAHSRDERGNPRTLTANFDLPMVVSVGAAYTGFERLVLATDVRYLDYKNISGFDDAGFKPDGSVAGLGWKGMFAMANGVQFQATDRLALRAGYTYNSNPISSSAAFFNLSAPLITQHVASVGSSYEIVPGCLISLSYTHIFENSLTGPLQTPLGAIPGSSITSSTSADALYAGILVRL